MTLTRSTGLAEMQSRCFAPLSLPCETGKDLFDIRVPALVFYQERGLYLLR